LKTVKFMLNTRVLLALVAVLLVFPLSAFTVASPKEQTQSTPKPPSAHTLKIGESRVIPYPIKNDPKFTIHITSWTNVAPRGINSSLHCPSTSAYTEGRNGLGMTAWTYQIDVLYCYDSTNILSITTPPYESVYTIWGWNLRHNASSKQYRSWAYGHGDYTESTFAQSGSGFLEVDAYGDGSSRIYCSRC